MYISWIYGLISVLPLVTSGVRVTNNLFEFEGEREINRIVFWNDTLDNYCKFKSGKNESFVKKHNCQGVDCRYAGVYKTPENYPCESNGTCILGQCVPCIACDWVHYDPMIRSPVIWNTSLDEYCKFKSGNNVSFVKKHDCKLVDCRYASAYKTPENYPCETNGTCINENCVPCDGCNWTRNDGKVKTPLQWDGTLEDYCKEKTGRNDSFVSSYDCTNTKCWPSGNYKTPEETACGLKGKCVAEKCIDFDECDWERDDPKIGNVVAWNKTLDEYCKYRSGHNSSYVINYDCKSVNCRYATRYKTPENWACGKTGRCNNEQCIDCAECDWERDDPGIKTPVSWTGVLDDYCKFKSGNNASFVKKHDCKLVDCRYAGDYKTPEFWACGTNGRCIAEKCIPCEFGECDWERNDNGIRHPVVWNETLDNYCKFKSGNNASFVKKHNCNQVDCRHAGEYKTPEHWACGTKGRCINEKCIDCEGCDWEKNDPRIKNPSAAGK